MEPINHHLSKEELRKFGLITAILFTVFFGLLLPWLFSAENFPIWPWFFSSGLIIWSLLHPKSLKFFYIPWMTLANLLGWVNSHIILSLLFFGIIFPVALLLKLLKKDPMNRKITSTKSYKKAVTPREKSHMERPY